jgi:hypothetical protein
MRIVFSPEARLEFAEAERFYEQQVPREPTYWCSRPAGR